MAKPLAKLVAVIKPKRRWAQFSIRSLLLVTAIVGTGFAWWLHEPYRLVGKLRNSDVSWDGGHFGLDARVTGDTAVSLLRHGRRATPALLDAIEQSDKFAAAHVLLTKLWQNRYPVSGAEWNHLRVTLYGNGKLDYHAEQIPAVRVYWQATISHLVASADPTRPFTSPKAIEPEYGHGLTADLVRRGWISLFDGETTFGWEGAMVEDALLSDGTTTTTFGDCQLRGDFATSGKVIVGGHTIDVHDGKFQQTLKDIGRGPVRLNPGLRVRSLAIRPLGMDSVHNGKDLSGWNAIRHPRLADDNQTRWYVEAGAIHSQGGPGALELDRRYGDCVIQLEIRTCAKLVNGGVFFRAVPGDFMNGYEAQVFNACYDQDRAQPVRYSTGAIDDRQLARRLVSNDLDTFSMTVIAVGPHIATWVNGVQMTDWTDDREPDDNPRNGMRLKPGTIQLQSHDSESDIEFRNIRVGEIHRRE